MEADEYSDQKMKKNRIFACVLVSSLLSSAAATAQSLAEVARAEEARRKTLKPPAKVYTNDDLGRSGDGPAPPPLEPTTAKAGAQGSAPGRAAPSRPAQPAESAPSERDEKYWRARVNDARTGVQRAQAFYDALQSQINGLYAQFVAVDDPAQRALIEKKRLAALAEQERVKADIAETTKAVADIEEEARRASVPPGWLR
jgi:uncharacterized membrane protein YqiK